MAIFITVTTHITDGVLKDFSLNADLIEAIYDRADSGCYLRIRAWEHGMSVAESREELLKRIAEAGMRSGQPFRFNFTPA